MNVVVATHGHCFDGLMSAALFTHLGRALYGRDCQFEYRACGYGGGQREATPELLRGDENAILDYRFLSSDRLTWYFDHHRTGFASDADRAAFDARQPRSRQFHYDASYTSCTKLIADVARESFGVDVEPLAEVVRWADIVDSAAFESADAATRRDDPVMQLVTVVEHYADDAFISKLVPEVLGSSLKEVATSKRIVDRYRPLGAKHRRFVERVRQSATVQGRVVLVDLTAEPLETIGKFVTYALYPKCTYSVVVGRLKTGVKISVGFNPWSGSTLDTDISAICARYGGGGHPVVGGISFALSEMERAQQIAGQIAAELG